MEQKVKLEFPLQVEIKYDDTEELMELASQDAFVTFMFGNAIAAIKQAIRKNKSECLLSILFAMTLSIVSRCQTPFTQTRALCTSVTESDALLLMRTKYGLPLLSAYHQELAVLKSSVFLFLIRLLT